MFGIKLLSKVTLLMDLINMEEFLVTNMLTPEKDFIHCSNETWVANGRKDLTAEELD